MGTTQLASRVDQMWPLGRGVVGMAPVVRLLLYGLSSMASEEVGRNGVGLPSNGPVSRGPLASRSVDAPAAVGEELGAGDLRLVSS
jgi:hypothetical protein